MILDLIPVLNAFIILGSVLLLGRALSNHFRSEQEYNRTREARFTEMVKEVNEVASEVHDATLFIIDYQKSFDDNMNTFAKFVDAHSKNVTLQQNHFNALAKNDMLAARREELLRTKELKIALERLMGVAFTSKQPPSPNDVLAIENLTKRIEELEELLN